MSKTLNEARNTRLKNLAAHIGMRPAIAVEAMIDGNARAVFREEMEKAEAERRQRFEEIKRTLGVPVYDEGGGGPEDSEEIARSRAPVGEDGVRYETVTVTDHGDGFDISRADQERLGLVGDQHYEIVEFLSDRRATIAIPTPPAKDTGEEEIIADLEQRLIEAKTERDEARSSLADAMAMISDPAAVHINMLRGTIAKPSVENIYHLYPEIAAVRSSLETAERRIGELEKALNSQALPIDRETLGRMVREAWIRWAQTQPAPKSSWLVPYDGLAEHDKEADRQIGEAVAKWTLVHAGARAALTPDAGTARSEDEEE